MSTSVAAILHPASGLSDAEAKALHDEAYRLMVDARVLGVGQQEDDDGIPAFDDEVFPLDVSQLPQTLLKGWEITLFHVR